MFRPHGALTQRRGGRRRYFALTFYGDVLNGQPPGPAVTKARLAVQKSGSADWADYIHYGSPNFILKARNS